jgi:hemolysin activation/secretion protein
VLSLLLAAPLAAYAQPGALILEEGRPDRAPPAAPSALPAPRGAPPGQVQTTPMPVKPFVLKTVRIEGGAVPAARLEPAWRPFVGRKVGEPELKSMADAISAAYGRADVSLYTIVTPRQTFGDGVVRLAVIEGFIEDVKITGPGDGKLLRAYAQQMRRDVPLKRSTLERCLSLMRDIPGLKIDVDLQRGSRLGGVIMTIATHRKRIDEGLSVNNRGTAYLGRTQIKADLILNSLPFQGAQTKLTFAAPTDFDRFQYSGVSQMLTVGNQGTTITFSGGYIRTRPAFSPIEGTADTWGVQISRPLIRSYQRNLYATIDLDGVDSTNTAYGQKLFSEKVRAARGALSYTDQKPTRSLTLSSTLSIGLNQLGAQSLLPGWSKPDFVKINLAAKYNQAFGKQVVLRLDAAGQYSGDKLPGSEQFNLGGEEFGRAFPSSIATGDKGMAGSAELAYRPANLPKALAGSEVYGFIDGGQVDWRARPGVASYTQDLSSAGGGVRFSILSKGVLEVEAAEALLDPAASDSRGWRVTVTVKSLLN